MVPILRYAAFEDKEHPGDWRAEAINRSTGEQFITLFGGDKCEERANQYVAWMNGNPVVAAKEIKPIARPLTTVVGDENLTLEVQDGKKVSLYLPLTKWTWNARSRTVTGRQLRLQAS